jgi:hypothetical protein
MYVHDVYWKKQTKVEMCTTLNDDLLYTYTIKFPVKNDSKSKVAKTESQTIVTTHTTRKYYPIRSEIRYIAMVTIITTYTFINTGLALCLDTNLLSLDCW